MRVLCHRADRRTVAVFAVAALTVLAPLLYAPPYWAYPPHLLASATVAFIACVITHNHVHAPVFAARGANRLFGLLLTLVKGHTTWTIYVPHVMNHHRHHGGDEDWIRVEHAGDSVGLARIVHFVLRASRCMQVSRRRVGAPRLKLALEPLQTVERAALLFFVVGSLAAAGPLRVALFLVVPWLAGTFALVAVNLFQHEECATDGGAGTARNFTGRFGNWLLFNNGFHAAHHLDPRRHWSELPALHAERVAPHAPELSEPSLTGYVLRRYCPRICPDSLLKGPFRAKVSA